MSRCTLQIICSCLVLIFCAAPAAWGDSHELERYQAAIGQRDPAARIRAIEQFLAAAPESRLKYDALEMLVWDCVQSNQNAAARAHATELLSIDRANALALAVESDVQIEPAKRKTRNSQQSAFEKAKQGIQSYSRLQRPAGMNDADFAMMRRYVSSTLSGQAGLGYLGVRDYETAREYLRQSVAGAPNDARYVYGLALALLTGKGADPREGYWQLARAVDLSKGTAAGEQIAQYARKSYAQAGGNNTAWDQFLSAAASKATAQGPAATTNAVAVRNTPPEPPKQSAALSASVKQAPSPAVLPPPAFQRNQVPRDAPLSLGILIQTAHLTKENREVLTSALTDMVRRLRRDDEAFIMSFSDKLDFEEDLTGNDKKLEDAISQVQPASGAALFDAVEFAAGHLERIGRNKNRVLLVISDGRNTQGSSNPWPFASELTRVRVDCIGMDAADTDDRKRLMALASYSGGIATFTSGPEQIRTATRELAQTMGIAFPR